MRILLSLPLLAVLFGCTLAEGDVHSRNCIGSFCIDCRNGVCKDVTTFSKRESSGGVTSSSSNCVTNNGHQTCTVCNNGVCHTTNNGKREASDVDQNTNTASSENTINIGKREIYLNRNDTGFEPGCNRTGCVKCTGLGHRNDCFFLPHPNCNATGCTYCGGLNYGNNSGPNCVYTDFTRMKRDVSQDQNVNSASSENNINIGKRESYHETDSESNCNRTGCIRCKGFGPFGSGCKFYPYSNCNATGCTYCKGADLYGNNTGPVCFYTDFTRMKRETSEDQNDNSASSENNINIGKRESYHETDSESNCNRTGCTRCKGYGFNGSGCKFYPYSNCNATGCTYCRGADLYGNNTGPVCFYTDFTRMKREASEDVTSISSNCVTNNGHQTCTVCTNEVCHTTNKKSTEKDNSFSMNCKTYNGHETCTICYNGNCRMSTNEKREATEDQNENNVSSENHINIGKREASDEDENNNSASSNNVIRYD